MKFIYPAVFKKKTDGGYDAYFPDLEFCEASGDTLDDAIDNANEAARTWITVELEEDEPILPHVSDPEDILLAEDELIRNISVNIRFYEGWDE
ncbi:type II toxin-antitoxin system HicB family antitoxin [[Ruminococcus] lactaris]|uniref:type II toxin-antitoxin system HicB family antitoxin n=1 Tax=[Ruminococcus] lactaris TaxID=46228 RepID=UPI0025D278A7|nr:type II toxin-antitoxin system HicB family antitoxin [uncultured Mediterraneibacter sp.]